jgi:hypothetical protein
MSSNNNIGVWAAISNFFASLLSKRSAEDKVLIFNNKLDTAIQAAEIEAAVEVIEQEAKIQEKINRKIAKDKNPIDVTKLKKGRTLYILDENDQRVKILFHSYDDKGVFDLDSQFYSYGSIHTYHGRPVILENSK